MEQWSGWRNEKCPFTASLHCSKEVFDLPSSTRVHEGQGFADLKTIQPGQSALFDLTWATLYGPGRITDLQSELQTGPHSRNERGVFPNWQRPHLSAAGKKAEPSGPLLKKDAVSRSQAAASAASSCCWV